MRALLAGFVLAWILGPQVLRTTVPIWLVFLLGVGLEVQFFAGGLGRTGGPARAPATGRRDRGPQAVDRERYGYRSEPTELLLVRDRGEQLWVPYSGEQGEELQALIERAREADGEELETAAALPPQPTSLRVRLRRLVVGLGLLGALAVAVWVLDTRTGWDSLGAETRAAAEARFSAEASRIAAKPVSVECDESGEHVGLVRHADGAAVVGGERAFLTPRRCLDLYRLAFEGEVTASQTARALVVLAHEAWHLRGVGDEGTAECYAVQSGVELGRRLGLPEDTARQLMRQQLAENRGRSLATLEYLVPPECRDGGRLDLAADTARFP